MRHLSGVVAFTLVFVLCGFSQNGSAKSAHRQFAIDTSAQGTDASAPSVSQTPTYTVLHTFSGSDGAFPNPDLVRDASGNLFGTTNSGGDLKCGGGYGCGVAFKLDPSGKESLLHVFTTGPGGLTPTSGLIQDSLGNLYGTTFNGSNGFAAGVAYRIATNGGFKELLNFGSVPGGGYYPFAGLSRDAAGNLYGITQAGGPFGNSGAIYKLDAKGNETVLHGFYDVAHGLPGYAGLVSDAAGNLFGTADGGNPSLPLGVVYELDNKGNFKVLHTFSPNDGSAPENTIIRDSAGSLYGTTLTAGHFGWGTIFKANAKGSFRVLHHFNCATDGGGPGPVVLDAAGNLYGTTYQCGAPNLGTIFKLAPNGRFTVLYTFAGGAEGQNPVSVTLGSDGNLYGAARIGSNRDGVLFMLKLH